MRGDLGEMHLSISPKILNVSIPGNPVACNNGLLSINYGLLRSIVACFFWLLGVPGRGPEDHDIRIRTKESLLSWGLGPEDRILMFMVSLGPLFENGTMTPSS